MNRDGEEAELNFAFHAHTFHHCCCPGCLDCTRFVSFFLVFGDWLHRHERLAWILIFASSSLLGSLIVSLCNFILGTYCKFNCLLMLMLRDIHFNMFLFFVDDATYVDAEIFTFPLAVAGRSTGIPFLDQILDVLGIPWLLLRCIPTFYLNVFSVEIRPRRKNGSSRF